ncbi:odorant receptor 45a-like [Stomoxys calcitrans]|uniref:Odorant receptor n=1 Tax=Stomoxys calcitrans TaxID=35570 RepID=A0A1I8NS40_STOCA|nr:odorant receptor 45a-like [Stomoxys calcitrans]
MWFWPKALDALPPQDRVQRYFFVQRTCFAAIGIDPTSIRSTIFNRFLAWIPMFCMLIIIGPMGLYALKYIQTDLDQMASALAPMWQAILSIVKFFLFMWNRKKIVRLVREVWMWSLEVNEKELVLLADEIRYDVYLSMLYASSCCCSAVLATLSPFIVALVYGWKGYGFWDSLEEPFKGVYFVNDKKTIWSYTFWYIWTLFAIHYVVNGTVAIDSLFSWFMRNISAQFQILNLRFQLASDNHNLKEGDNNQPHEDLNKSIIECIKYHQRIIELAEKFNDVYKHLVFVKFLVSCIQLACLTFQFQQGNSIVTQMFNFSFFITATIQLMIYCHGGQRIKDMSLSVSTSLWEHFNWHNLHPKSQKLLLLPLQRSQMPCNLIGIFFVADFNLFVWVFRTAASFMTMMLTVDKK